MDYPTSNPQERRFEPYADNGGTILSIAGADFSVIAGDTRQSEGYSIQTRYAPKVFRLYVRLSALCGLSSRRGLNVRAIGLIRLCWQSMDSRRTGRCL